MWFVDKSYPKAVVEQFANLEKVFSLKGGDRVSSDSLSEVLRMEVNGVIYYVKRYSFGGKHLRKYIGRSRCRAEWENLIYFQQLGIKTPKVAAYGEEKKSGLFNGRSVLITEEVKNTRDLAYLALNQSELFRNRAWKQRVFQQVAANVAKLHDRQFIHNDLNWRNILVSLDEEAQVYFLDVPMGRRYFTNVYRFKAKDLSCLDKFGKRILSRTDRLRFYCYYRGIKKLTAADKALILRSLEFRKPKQNQKI